MSCRYRLNFEHVRFGPSFVCLMQTERLTIQLTALTDEHNHDGANIGDKSVGEVD